MATLPFPCASVPLAAADFNATLTALGADAPSVWAILNVESGKAGYLADRRPQILFEYGQFHTRTGGIYDQTNPDISASGFGDYPGGAAEYGLLGEAYALNADAALQSASWGIGQVMGFNFATVGYANVSAFVQDCCASEALQLHAFQAFLIKKNIAAALATQDWNTVALRYNGSGQVAKYAAMLTASYGDLQDPAKLPDLQVRAAQLYLTFLMSANNNQAYNPAGPNKRGGIDGILGTPGRSNTLAALNAFQNDQGIAPTTTVDDNVLASLVAPLPAAANLSLS